MAKLVQTRTGRAYLIGDNPLKFPVIKSSHKKILGAVVVGGVALTAAYLLWPKGTQTTTGQGCHSSGDCLPNYTCVNGTCQPTVTGTGPCGGKPCHPPPRTACPTGPCANLARREYAYTV